MPPSLSFLTQRWATANAATRRDALRVGAIGLIHLAALVIMAWTEYALEQRVAFLLTWALLNFFWLALLRRPGIAAALSLAMIVALIQLSLLKFKVLWMTVNFVDLMVIDPDTVAFLFTIFPGLRSLVLAAVAAAIPVLILLWHYDPFRVRRTVAAAGAVASVVGLVGLSHAIPMETYEGFYGNNFVSHFARSGVDAISALLQDG